MARRHKRQDMAMDDMGKKHWMMHKRMKAAEMLVLGALVFVNIYYPVVSWPQFIGGVLVLGGLLKLAMPGCRHCRM